MENQSVLKGLITNMFQLRKSTDLQKKSSGAYLLFISPIDFHKIEDIIPSIYEKGRNPLILVLDRVTDVRNFGFSFAELQRQE